MKRNMIIPPKPSKKTGFTSYTPHNAILVADHVAEFLANKGEIQYLPTVFGSSPKARMGFSTSQGV